MKPEAKDALIADLQKLLENLQKLKKELETINALLFPNRPIPKDKN